MVALFPDEIRTPVQGKSNEWYTPAKYVEAAREVMGGIDLDPASCEMANQTVKATRFYTQEDNGLEQEWYGNVWLNPPYGRTEVYGSNIRLFTNKLVDDYHQRSVKQAILLSSGKTDSPWFSSLWDFPICFADHDVRFARNYDTVGSPGRYTTGHIHGTIFVYFGSHEDKFIDIFSQFGTIAKRVSTPKVPLTSRSLWEENT